MQVSSIAAAGERNNPFQRDIDHLIETVGTPRFDIQLFQTAAEAVRCEHLCAFAVGANNTPRTLLAVNNGGGNVAQYAGSVYTNRYWNADPVNHYLGEARDHDPGIMVVLSGQEMETLRFRRGLYSHANWEAVGVNLIHSASLIRRHNDETLKVTFYRHRAVGPFQAQDYEKILGFSSLLFPLLLRHAPVDDAQTDSHSLRRKFAQCLERASLGLTAREIEVCAAIAVGMSSQGIALTLDITCNTVLTYRKRAYARLGICSQNELLRLIYRHLQGVQ